MHEQRSLDVVAFSCQRQQPRRRVKTSRPAPTTVEPLSDDRLAVAAPQLAHVASEQPRLVQPSNGVRVNKCFRAFASRREADAFVEGGRVTVNGVTATNGQMVNAGDSVCLDGKPVEWETLQYDFHKPVLGSSRLSLETRYNYCKYYKPVGITCTLDTGVVGNLVAALGTRVVGRMFSVGRLDRVSSGLLLLTSDGRVPNAVLRSGFGHEKEYVVRTESRVTDAHMQQLRSGVVITTVAQRDGRRAEPLTAATLPCEVHRGTGPNELRITLTEGRNRQVRKMLGSLGYTVLALHRVRFMSIRLDDMQPDELRPLSETEMACIRSAVISAAHTASPASDGDGQSFDD